MSRARDSKVFDFLGGFNLPYSNGPREPARGGDCIS